MNLDQLIAFLKANGGTAEQITFLETLRPVNADSARVFLETTEEGKRLVNSLTDQKVTQGIATFKTNNLAALVSAEYSRLHPDESAESKRIRMLEQKLEESDKKNLTANLRAKALTAIAGKKISPDVLNLIAIGDTEEAVNSNVTNFVTLFEAAVNEQVEAKFTANGRVIVKIPEGGDYKGKNPFSKEHFNLTEQAKLEVENPDLAKQLKALAKK